MKADDATFREIERNLAIIFAAPASAPRVASSTRAAVTVGAALTLATAGAIGWRLTLAPPPDTARDVVPERRQPLPRIARLEPPAPPPAVPAPPPVRPRRTAVNHHRRWSPRTPAHTRAAPTPAPSPAIADPLTGEALRRALIRDRELTREANRQRPSDRSFDPPGA